MQASDTSNPATPICWFCGEPEVLEIDEVWLDFNFTLDTAARGCWPACRPGSATIPRGAAT